MKKINDIAPNFTDSEFECSCGCGTDEMDVEFLMMLQSARTIARVPFSILSGARCPDHNDYVGGSSTSAHVPEYMPSEKAHAADIIYTSSKQCFTIVDALIRAGFNRIGINNGTIHADNAHEFDTKESNVLWNYYK